MFASKTKIDDNYNDCAKAKRDCTIFHLLYIHMKTKQNMTDIYCQALSPISKFF